jgi:glycosyltransferase involved in cell wall biosynthesis
MRICHVITRLIIGGAQENTILSCEGLAELGHEVHLVAGPQTGPEGSLWPRAASGGYMLHRLERMRRDVRPMTDLRCLFELTSLLREMGPDVVHTHSSKAGIIGRAAARRAGVPHVIHSIHGMSFNRTQPWPSRFVYRTLERWCGRWTEHFVCVADAMTRQAVAAGLGAPERFTTVYSGMEVERFDPRRHDRAAVRQQLGFDEDAIVVGTVARLFKNKGYEQLLEVLPTCVEQAPELRFLWVGDGPHRDRYIRRLEEMGLRDRVHLTGLVSPERVAELLAGTDVVVHLSQWEGLPRVLAQALLMEVPVISFDNDGAPEVAIQGQTGELIRLNDLAGLSAAIVKLAGDAALRRRYGRTGREMFLQRFDHREMVRRLDELYEKLAAERVGRTS